MEALTSTVTAIKRTIHPGAGGIPAAWPHSAPWERLRGIGPALGIAVGIVSWDSAPVKAIPWMEVLGIVSLKVWILLPLKPFHGMEILGRAVGIVSWDSAPVKADPWDGNSGNCDPITLDSIPVKDVT